MRYRNLGRSGLMVSPLCLGTMMFGGATSEADSARIVARAHEQGINFIDTADDEALVDRLVTPGHPSTPGYNDPAYPLEGRVPRG